MNKRLLSVSENEFIQTFEGRSIHFSIDELALCFFNRQDSLFLSSDLSFVLNKNPLTLGCYCLLSGDYELISEFRIEVTIFFIDKKILSDFFSKYFNELNRKYSNVELSSVDQSVVECTYTEVDRKGIDLLKHSNELSYPDPYFQLLIESIFYSIFFIQDNRKFFSICHSKVNFRYERLKCFMEKNYLNDWDVNHFSREFGSSKSSFKSLFKEVYNQAPKSWINDKRLLTAKHLLSTTNKSVIDIALDCSFSSHSYFTQAYKKKFGIAPIKDKSGHIDLNDKKDNLHGSK